MIPYIRSLLAMLTALAFLPVAALAEEEGLPPAAAQRKAEKFTPTGSVTIKAISVKVGLGVSWGEGILTFRNENHPFKVTEIALYHALGHLPRPDFTHRFW